MVVAYTDNFNFPLLDDGGKSWGAVQNGINFDVDVYLSGLNALTPIIITHENDILVHEGNVLKMAVE